MNEKYSINEVAKHTDMDSLWIILENKVYDVTKFMLEHPGGEDVLLQWAGQDATDAFNDIGHSADAKQMTNDYMIGELSGKDTETANADTNIPEDALTEKQETWWQIFTSPTWSNFIIPVALSIGVYVLYKIGNELLKPSRSLE